MDQEAAGSGRNAGPRGPAAGVAEAAAGGDRVLVVGDRRAK